ncbi:MAG: hypothetical protein WC410_02620 [Candidatus Paceibacterota bacterium]
MKNSKELEKYLCDASVFVTEYEDGQVYDVMVLIEDDNFINKFSFIYGPNFVVDKHVGGKDVFIRVKNYSWLEKDLSRRLPIALWILNNSTIIQEKGKKVTSMIGRYQNKFESFLEDIVRQKYLELRTERHNLRFSIRKKNNDIASIIIKSTIVKLCLEICLLLEKKPYPFKVLLPRVASEESKYGKEILDICKLFLESNDAEKSIILSDKLIKRLIDILVMDNSFPKDFLERWWLYLS